MFVARQLLLLLFCLASQSVWATHIFGGYLSMDQLDQQAGRFQLTLHMYVDLAEVKPADEDNLLNGLVVAGIYRVRDNAPVLTVFFDSTATSELIYQNQACAQALNLRTREYRYYNQVILPPAEYSDPQGYYIIWERCCRNAAVLNLSDPFSTGIVLRTQFPALMVNGQPTRFSTPKIPVLSGAYFCAFKTATYGLAATDPDGDELRFSLTTPKSGFSSLQFPLIYPRPDPHPLAIWAPGFSFASVIPGSPALSINSRTGELSVKPNRLGIFVFAILIEKWRDNQLIGSLHLEFQVVVVDCRSKKFPPAVITYKDQPVNQLSICPGDTVTLQTQPASGYTFQWQQDGANLPNGTGLTWVADQVGNYTVVKSLSTVCATDTTSQAVQITATHPSPTHILAVSPGFCTGDSVVLTAQSTQAVSYTWSRDGKLLSNAARLTVRQAGLYHLTGKTDNGFCNPLPDSLAIQEWPLPRLPAGQIQQVCPGDSVLISTSSQPNWQYQWYIGSKLIGQSASISVIDTGRYVVKVVDAYGCRNKSTPYLVTYRPDCAGLFSLLYIPSAFTPNGDGINDRWEIRNIAGQAFRVSIFNRWGELIYYSLGYSDPWDGMYHGVPLATGLYTYVIVLPNGGFTYRGTVTLL